MDKKTKIALINTYYKERSTGSTCYDIVQSFNNEKYECRCCYFVNDGNYDYAKFLGMKYDKLFHSAVSHFIGLEGYASTSTTKKLIDYLLAYRPDIVHLFVLHSHILNLKMVFEMLNELNCKVFVHLDDCWWFTGKCMYPIKHDCTKFTTQCDNCPARHDSPNSYFFDFSKKMQKDKSSYFSIVKSLSAIGVSNWVKLQAEKSSVFKERKVHLLNNWIDESIFYPDNIERNSTNKLLFVSSMWPKDSSKYRYLIQLYSLLKDEFEFTVVGDTCGNDMKTMNAIGVINNTNDLAQIYRTHGIYVHLSEFDTFGKVVMEAIFCGTPVVAFNNTVMKEVIADCGEVAINKDINDLAKHVNIVRNNLSQYRNNIKKRDLSPYTKNVAMKLLENIYLYG